MLEWVAPDATNDDLDGSEEGPSVILHYVVEVSDDQGQTWSSLAQVMGLSSYTDGGLEPGTTRDYRVAAVNATAESVWSNTAESTTIAAVLPNEPGGLAAEAYGTSSIKLCWNAQATAPEAAPVTSYRIEHLVGGTWTYLNSVTGDVGSVPTIYTVTGLTPVTSYEFRVSAINLRGQSDQSDVATATTDAGSPSTALTAPSGLTGAIGADSSTIELNWTAGDNADVHFVFGIQTPSYDVGSLVWETADASDSHTVNMMGKPSGSYMFFVIAGQTDDAGDTTWSAWTPGTPGTVEYP